MAHLNHAQLRRIFDNKLILLIEDEPQSDTYNQIIPTSDQLDELTYLLHDFFTDGVMVGDRNIALPSDIESFYDGEYEGDYLE